MNNTAKYIDTRRFKSHTPCPMCGCSVSVGDLFCVKCGMRIHSHQYRKSVTSKANLRSIYIFYNERDYENTKDAIYYGNRVVYNKLNWYGDWRNINVHEYAQLHTPPLLASGHHTNQRAIRNRDHLYSSNHHTNLTYYKQHDFHSI